MEAWREAFTQLKGQYISRSGQRLEQIGALLAALAKQPEDFENLRQAMRHFHWLAGSGGIYDLPIISDVGGHGEGLCDQLLTARKPISPADVNKLKMLIQTAQKSLEGETAQDDRIVRAERATVSLELDVVLYDSDPISLKKITGTLE
ncbi:MAG TPA: Hpt domain-containing protein, partial [Chroococcales cyanobacterium]